MSIDICPDYGDIVSELITENEKLIARIAELEAENLELRKTLGWAYDIDEYKEREE